MSAPLALDLEGPITDGFRTVMTFIPKLLGFLLMDAPTTTYGTPPLR